MATSAQLAKKLAAYDANRKSSADVLNEALTQHGVPELRTRVSGLRTTLTNTENALNAVDPSVTGRTSRSLVTEAQRQRIVNKEREPIAEQYGSISRTLGNESANLTEQQRAADQLAQGMMNDYTIGRNALQSQYEGAVGRESESRRRAEADRAFRLERQREKRARQESDRNYRLALQEANKPSGGGGGGSNSDGSKKSKKAPSYQLRKDGGFNFQNEKGKAISARLYAQLTGTNFNTLLKKMAAAGDKGAKDVLKNGGSAKSYKALTWN